jgi:hypothetical protein
MIFEEYVLALFILTAIAWILIGSRGNALVKSLYIVGLIVSSLFIFNKIKDYQGRPLPQETIPEDFIHVASIIHEADKIMFLWITIENIEEEPLSLKLPYNRDVHKVIQKGKAKGKGKPFRIKVKGKKGEGESTGNKGKPGEQAKGKKGPGNISLKSISDINLDEMPLPILPEKFEQ